MAHGPARHGIAIMRHRQLCIATPEGCFTTLRPTLRSGAIRWRHRDMALPRRTGRRGSYLGFPTMALSYSRRPARPALARAGAAARPVASRRAPAANAGVLASLENIGRALRARVDASTGFSADDTVLLLGHIRDIYRVVRAMRPV
jgi:hypothetical protein